MKFILLQENLQQARSILRKLDISEDDDIFKSFKEYYERRLGNNWGYFGFLTKLLFKKKEKISEVKILIDFIAGNKDIVKELPKNIINYDSLEKIWDDVIIQKEWRKYRQEFVNELTGKIKQKAKKDEDLKNEYINSDNETKKDILQNFIPKIAKYDNYKKFKSDLKSYLNRTDNIEDLIKNIKDQEHAYLVYNENNIVIAEIYKYEASCKLGSKSWCISTGETWWNNYVSGMNKQYFIWNLNVPKSSNESQVGVTIKENGAVGTAHYKNDERASVDPYLNKYDIPKNIFTPIDIDKDFAKILKADRLDKEVFDNMIKNDNKELIEKYYDIIPTRLKIKYGLYDEEELHNMNLSDVTKEILRVDNDTIGRMIDYLSHEETINHEEKKLIDKMSFVDKMFFLKRAMTLNLNYGSDFDEVMISKKLFTANEIDFVDFDEELIYIEKEKVDFFTQILGMDDQSYYNLSTITSHGSMYADTEEINYCLGALNSDQRLEFTEILEFLEKNSYHEKLEYYFTKLIKEFINYEPIKYFDTESFFREMGLSEVFEIFDLCSSAIEEGAEEYISEDKRSFSDLENKFEFGSNGNEVGIPIDMIIDSFNDRELTDEDFDYISWENGEPLSNEVPDFNATEVPYDYYSMAEVSDEYKEKIDKQLEELTNDLEDELSEFLDKNSKETHELLIDNRFEDKAENNFFYYERKKDGLISIIPLTNIIKNGNAVIFTFKDNDDVKKNALYKIKYVGMVTNGDDNAVGLVNRDSKRFLDEGINVKQINIFDQFQKDGTNDPDQLNLFEEKLIISYKKFKQRRKY